MTHLNPDTLVDFSLINQGLHPQSIDIPFGELVHEGHRLWGLPVEFVGAGGHGSPGVELGHIVGLDHIPLDGEALLG